MARVKSALRGDESVGCVHVTGKTVAATLWVSSSSMLRPAPSHLPGVSTRSTSGKSDLESVKVGKEASQ